MDVYSWVRRSLSRSKRTTLPAGEKSKECLKNDGEEHQLYGVTEALIEFIKSFSVETFRNFSLPDEERAASEDSEGTSGNIRQDLSDWQQHHALLVLSKVKELAQLRFKLCPRCLKEQQFWTIYFILVKSYVAEYELQAVRLARLKQMSMENESIPDVSTCEVEMLETKQKTHAAHEISLEDSDCHDNIKN
nr:BSD domain containing protein [Ipomoea batatas]